MSMCTFYIQQGFCNWGRREGSTGPPELAVNVLDGLASTLWKPIDEIILLLKYSKHPVC